MNTIKYIDTNSYATMHEQFNASLLLMCCTVFNKINYFANSSSRKCVMKLLALDSLDCTNKIYHKRIWSICGTSRLKSVLRLFLSAIQNVFLLIFSRPDQLLIYNYNNLFALFTLNVVNKILKRKVVVFCHGEMEFIISEDKSGGLAMRMQRWLCKSFFLSPKRTTNLYFAVMGSSILNNIRSVVNSNLAEHFISVDHSYIFGDTVPKNKVGDVLRVGTVGVMSQYKGFDELCVLVQKIGQRKDIEVSVTGRIFGDIGKLQEYGINLASNCGSGPISSDEFSDRIKRLDYILFLYPRESYKMIASGAVMDSINQARPIISLHNEYFDYLFDKYGHFGYLVDSVEEAVELITSLRDNTIQCKNIDFTSLRTQLSPVVVSAELERELAKIGYL